MMDATQVAQLMSGISAVLTFAVVGVLFGSRRDVREARESESKARQQADEAERRAQDLALAVERAEREATAENRAQSAFDEERQARPSVESMGGPALEDDGLAYTFRVRNRGKVFADNVTLCGGCPPCGSFLRAAISRINCRKKTAGHYLPPPPRRGGAAAEGFLPPRRELAPPAGGVGGGGGPTKKGGGPFGAEKWGNIRWGLRGQTRFGRLASIHRWAW